MAWGEGHRGGERLSVLAHPKIVRGYAQFSRASWASCCLRRWGKCLLPSTCCPLCSSRRRPSAKAVRAPSPPRFLLAGERATLWVSEHLPDTFSAPQPPLSIRAPPNRTDSCARRSSRRLPLRAAFSQAFSTGTNRRVFFVLQGWQRRWGGCPENLETSQGREGPYRRTCVGPLGDAGDRHGVMEPMSRFPTLLGRWWKEGVQR